MTRVEVDRYPFGTTNFTLATAEQHGNVLTVTTEGVVRERFNAGQWYEAREYRHGYSEPKRLFVNRNQPERTSVRPPSKAVA